MTLRTITDITTIRTVWEVHGTGAVTMTLGTGTRGHITLGVTTTGTTEAGIMQAGMTLGTMADIGAITILGIMADGAGMYGTDITHIITTIIITITSTITITVTMADQLMAIT
jgi:hypothetical protein